MRFLILLTLLGIFDFTKCFAEETITSTYRPQCDFSGPSKNPKKQFAFSLKFKYPHPSNPATGDWEQIFQGYCDLENREDDIYIATLSDPLSKYFNITALKNPSFKCDYRGNLMIMSWGVNTVIINLSNKKATYSNTDGTNVETSCK